MAAEPMRAPLEADEVWPLDPDEVPEVCEALELEVELVAAEELERLAEVAMLELAEDETDEDEAEAEADVAALAPEAEADDEDELDEAAAEADTILPLPQGIAGPSGWLAKGGEVVAPLASAMANRVVQVGSAPL